VKNAELIEQSILLPRGKLELAQPRESAELPDAGAVEWAPFVPFWSVLWRSGVALAREADDEALRGKGVVELGCGLAVPSIAAARAGADVLATDRDWEALTLAERNARANGVELNTVRVDWTQPGKLVDRGPFDLVLAADLLYEKEAADMMLDLLPRLAPEAWLADPGRVTAESFVERAASRWPVETTRHGVVTIHKIRFEGEPLSRAS
jgi:predicted nicotinamide N-methyase